MRKFITKASLHACKGELALNLNLHPFEVYRGGELMGKFSNFDAAKFHAECLERPLDEEGRSAVVEVVNRRTWESFVIVGQQRLELSGRTLRRKGVIA